MEKRDTNNMDDQGQPLELSERDRKLFVELMLSPPRPTEAALRAVARHRELVEER